MNKLRSLLKATMSGGLQIFNYQAKSERSKKIMPLFLGLLFGLMMLFSASAVTTELAQDGKQSAILPLYTLITAIIIVMEGSYKASDLLFKPRDNDMLLAMPIKKSAIVFTRMLKFYLFEMVYCLIFLLPAIIAYAMNAETGISFWVVAITMLIFVPVIPVAVACIIGLIIAALSGSFKHKTFLQVVLSLVVMFAITGLAFAISTTSGFDGQDITVISNAATQFYYPASVFVNLTEHFDIWAYLLFILVNLIVAAVAVLVVSRFCFRIITRLDMVNLAKTKGVRYKFKESSQTFAMIKKEMTRYFNTPVLLMNTAMGLVLYIIAVVLLCLNFDNLANSLTNSVEDFPLTIDGIRALMPGVAFAMVAFASLLTCITATMISLEGKAFNLLKTLPISGKKVLMAKVLSATILIVPVTLLGWFVMCFRFQFGVLDAILVLIGTVTMPLVTELIGILINLRYPRFDADNDAAVVRQSASVMVATFLGLGMVLITISLTFAIIFLAGQTAGLIIMNAVYVIVALFLYFAIVTQGDEKYLKLAT